MAFEDLNEFFDSTLRLPIGGKDYVVPAPSADLGLFCQLIVELTRRVRAGEEISETDRAMLNLDDDEEKIWHRRILGTAYDDLVADGIDWVRIKHASQTTFTWITSGRAAAELVWGSTRPEGRAVPTDRQPKKTKKSARPGSPAGTTPTTKVASPGVGSSSTGT